MKIKYDFHDLLIVPAITTKMNSRYKDVRIKKPYPLFAAPMDTVINLENIDYFLKHGIKVCIPRTISLEEFNSHVRKNGIFCKSDYENIFVSFGFDDIDALIMSDISDYSKLHKNINILIDVANGHLEKIGDYCRKIKNIRPDIGIMVGNIANPLAYKYYSTLGCVDYIRCGIGAGGGCTTTKHSSIGYPMASLILEIREIKNRLIELGYDENILPQVIADGGMKDYSDIIKALGIGADGVMIGSIFNKCIESAGDNYFCGIKIGNSLARWLFKRKFKIKKYFRGMSTKEAQKAMGKKNLKTSEGVIRYRNVEYTLPQWIENFDHYLRSAMSYCDCYSLSEFIGGVDYIQITNSSYNRFDK